MRSIDRIQQWMDHELDDQYITGNRWDGHKNYFIQVTREDEKGKYSYNFGYQGIKGKWTTITNKRYLTKLGLLKQFKHIKTDYNYYLT